MKRFLLFSADDYECSGGWYDFIDSFDTSFDAQNTGIGGGLDWFHIVDTSDGSMSEWQKEKGSQYRRTRP